MVVGELTGNEQIPIERPMVTEDIDPDEPSHWKTIQENDVDAVLRVGNDDFQVPVGVIIRINKPATANAVGVSWT